LREIREACELIFGEADGVLPEGPGRIRGRKKQRNQKQGDIDQPELAE
jgi:hypothetical protein